MSEIYIEVTKNSRVEDVRKQVKINTKDNFEKILNLIGSKLKMDVKTLYSCSGAIIDDANDIRSGELIYVSQGEAFWPKNSAAIINLPSTVVAENKKIVKLGVIGPPSVGKSALSIRYIQKVFIDEYLPTFESMFKKDIILDKEPVQIDILDFSGMDELVVMRPAWFKGCDGFLMVYAINDRVSFDALRVFKDQLVTFKQSANNPLIVIGNKCDLKEDRKIKYEEGAKVAKEWGASFYETSAKKDLNVTQVFEQLAKEVFKFKYENKIIKERQRQRDDSERENQCSCCVVF